MARRRPPHASYRLTGQEQFIAYWTTEAGWHCELQLRNNLAGGPLTVTPAVRAPDGTETGLLPVVIQAREAKSIDLDAAIGTLAPHLLQTYGSIVLRYHSPDFGNLSAALMIHNAGHPFAFHIDGMGEEVNLETASREGVWWLPMNTTSDYLILTNRGGDSIPLDLSLYDARGKEAKQKLALGPRQTSRFSVRQLIQAAGLEGSYGGIKILANAHAGSLDSLHFIFDEKAEFSALLKMFNHDPNATLQQRDYAKTAQWTLRAPMLALAKPDPALAFPPGTTLRPQLFVRNTTGKVVDVALRFNWRSGAATGKAPGPVLHLNPFETRRVDVGALQDGVTLPQDANWASVTLTANGAPEEVMAVAASYDATLRYGAQTPFSDQLALRWAGGVWEYDAMHNSFIAVGNGGTKPTRAALTLFYNQGAARYDLEQSLQPDEQMWIDVGKLIREHAPDINGKTLPVDLSKGSYEIRDLVNRGIGALFEGKITYDKTYGHAAYGCVFCCGYKQVVVAFNPLGIPVLSTADNSVSANDTCTNQWEDVGDSFYYNWTTAQPSIATVNAYGTHTGVSVGSTTSATYGYLQSIDRFHDCPIVERIPQGQDNVHPHIDSVSPSRGLIAATTSNVTISGSGFTGGQVNTPTGISVSNVSIPDDKHINLNLVISSSATPGNNAGAISVTASNLTSNAVDFFVQVPTYFTPTGSGPVLNNLCAATSAYYAYVNYQVSDQAMNAISAGGLTPQESVSVNGGAYSPFASFATPVSTTASGTFEDIPIGTCFSVPPPPNRCIPVAQRFQILIPGVGTPFPITTTTSNTECEEGIKIIISPVPPGTTYSYGILN